MTAVMERIPFFHPVYGVGVSIAAGSGRSWMDQPDGDPVHAHLHLDIEGPLGTWDGTDVRLVSHSGFVRWADLGRFAEELDRLAGLVEGAVDLHAAPGFRLTVRLREDGHLRTEVTFTVGHHIEVDVVARTSWTWHHGMRGDLPALADRLRDTVRAVRPGQSPRHDQT